MLLAFVCLFATVFAAVIFPFEQGVAVTSYERRFQDERTVMLALDATPSIFHSISSSAYWVLQTLTTVGHGEIVPISDVGLIIGGIAALCALTLPITVVSVHFDPFHQEYKTRQRISSRPRVMQYRLLIRGHTRPLPMPTRDGSFRHFLIFP